MVTVQKLEARQASLTKQHRDLDEDITSKFNSGKYDDLELTSMKKRKLQMREEILTLNSQIDELRLKETA